MIAARQPHEIYKRENSSGIIYPEESYAIVGACFKVYKVMGCGFLESLYQDCMEIELERQEIPLEAQREVVLKYNGRELKHRFKLDIVCYSKIILELKAVSNLADEHKAQVINYLNAANLKLGILVNFGHYPGLEYERLVLTGNNAKRSQV